MKKLKRIISWILVCLVIFTLMGVFTGCTDTNSIQIPQVQDGVFIYDEDNIIDDTTQTSLNQMLVSLEEQTGVEFAVLTVESLQNVSIETYANKVFNTWAIGKKDKDNGILLLISRSDIKVRLEIGVGLEGILNDAKCGRILNNYFVPYREEDKYTEAVNYTVQAVINALSKEYETDIENLETDVVVPEEDSEEWTVGEIILLIIVILGCIVILSAAGGGGGSSSGGYYGGFSSGGSFRSSGGFGGGFSRGGGASK